MTLRACLLAAYLALPLLAGCGSDPAPIEDEPPVEEPITGEPESPPLGSPRPKLPPRDVVAEDED